MNVICPYCERKTPIPVQAELNCEYYGDNCFRLRCNRCKKVYAVEFRRAVKGTAYPISDNNIEPDFENDKE